MCGLVGMITKHRNGFSSHNMEMFDLLLFLDQLRGNDSTGVFSVNNVGNVTIAKQTGDSTKFLKEADWKKIRMEAISDGWAMIGHNRKATRGEISDANAHPFWVDEKLVLVHNGSMYGEHKSLKDTAVDSEAIAHVLAEEPDVEKAIQKVNAAYALIWYEVEHKRLNVLRNNARPLAWVETSDAWYFASEMSMLVYAMIRCNVRALKDGGPDEFEAGWHDTWTLQDDKGHKLTSTKIDNAYKPPSKTESVANFSSAPSTNLVEWSDSDTLDPPELVRLRAVGQQIADDALALSSNEDEYSSIIIDLEQEALKEAKEAIEKAKPDHGRPISHDKPIPDWTSTHTYTEWVQAKLKYEKQRVRVECRDSLLEDAGPNKVYMTGKTTDGVYCIFPIARMAFDAITDPKGDFADRKVVEFNVEVDVVGWKPVEEKQKDYNQTKGLITLMGRDAKLYRTALH